MTTQTMLEAAQTRATSVIFVIVGFTAIITQVSLIRITRKIGEKQLASIGAALLALTLLTIAFAPALWVLWVAAVGLALGNSMLNTSLSSLITQAAGPSERGSISGTQQGLGSLARMIAPPINNYMVGVNTAIPFLSSFVMMSVAFVLSLRLKQPTQAKPEAPNEYPVPPASPERNGHAGTTAESSSKELPLH